MSAPESFPVADTTTPVYVSTAKPKPPLTPEEEENMTKPKVLISGAGLGGLTLAILLHKANVPIPGSGIALGPTVAPLFQQMGIYDEFVEISKHYTKADMYDENLKKVHTIEIGWLEKFTKYKEYIVSRPELYNLLWRYVPREKILLGKKVLSFMQNKDGVMIRCSDNTTYHGDILVGADGAYSAVRQHLFKELKAKKVLPSSDDVPLPFSCVCLVGQTVPLDPEEFSELKSEHSQFTTVLGLRNRCTWASMSTKQNTICWGVILFLNKETSKENDSFRNSEWGPEAAEAMCKEVRGFKVPGGAHGKVLTVGDYVDRTPKGLTAKVMLEEKVFDTWFGCRTVLLGDACHKFNPAGVSGALTAMHDAVTLANWICTLKSAKLSQIEHVFEEYQAERLPIAKVAAEWSQMFTRYLGKSAVAVVVRALMKRYPMWLWRRVQKKFTSVRPQASFLPRADDQGTVKAIPQPSYYKTRAIIEQRGLCGNNAVSQPNVPVTI